MSPGKVAVLSIALVASATVGVAAKQTRITFSCWGNQNIFDGIKDRIKVFERQNPDIKVDFRIGGQGKPYLEQLTTWIAGGSGPDVFEVEYYAFWRFAEWGVLQDLASYVKGDREVAMNDLYPVCVDASMYKGRQYGLPYDVSAVWVTYNKDILSQAGLTTPIQQYQRGTWDWDSLREMAIKSTKRNGTKLERSGILMNWGEYPQMGWIWGAGGKFFNDDKTKSYFAGQANLDAVKFLQDMTIKDGAVQRPSEPYPLTQSKWGLYVGWTTMPSFLTANKVKFGYDMVPMPKGPKSDSISAQIHSISMLKSSKNKAAAWKFTKFLTGKEGYTYAIKDTFFSSTRHSLDKFYRDFAAKAGIEGVQFYGESMKRTKLYEVSPRFTDIQATFNAAAYPVWEGKADPAQAMLKVEKQANAFLADAAKRGVAGK